MLRLTRKSASKVAPHSGPAVGAPPFFPNSADSDELKKVDTVLPGKLFISNWRGVEQRVEFGVSHIAAIGEEFVDDTAPGIAYFHHDISDDDFEGTKMAENLRTAAAFVNDAISGGGRCLVHCAAGISRSATVVLAYRVLYGKLTLRAAFAELYGCRKCIWPNDGFMEALIALERDVFKGVATIELEQYVEWGEYDPDVPQALPEASVVRASRTPIAKPFAGFSPSRMFRKQNTGLDFNQRLEHKESQDVIKKRPSQKELIRNLKKRESTAARESRALSRREDSWADANED